MECLSRFTLVVAVVVVVVVVGLLSGSGEAVRFDVESGHTKCISEEIKAEAMTVGKYSVVNPSETLPLPESHKVNVRVIAPTGNKYNYHSADLVGEGKFSFQPGETGDYVTCFTAATHEPQITITVDFEWKSGFAATNLPSIAKKGSIDAMEQELNRLHEAVKEIHAEMIYLRLREEEMQELNNATNSKLTWMGFSSLLICMTVAALQYWHLKTFFEKKKII